MYALLGVEFVYRRLQTAPHQTFFCEDFSKEDCIVITHEVLGTKHNIAKTLANIDPETLGSVTQNTPKRSDASLREGD
jgi:hypothetical protein